MVMVSDGWPAQGTKNLVNERSCRVRLQGLFRARVATQSFYCGRDAVFALTEGGWRTAGIAGNICPSG